MTLLRTDSDNAEFRGLVALLDQELRVRDGADHAFFAQYNKLDHIRHTVVYNQDNVPLACGAFKEFEPGTVEIKRMFVMPAHRGHGIARLVLQELEQWAKELGYRRCVLETGLRQPEAIRLYEKAHYTRIPNYGQYADVASSVCFERYI
jgi:putative acetyltransferase